MIRAGTMRSTATRAGEAYRPEFAWFVHVISEEEDEEVPERSSVLLQASRMTRGPRSASVQGHVHNCSTPASPGSSQHTAAHDVLSALPAQLQSHDEHKESFTFLEAFCQDKSLLALIKVHEKLQQFVKNSPAPSLHRARNLLDDLTPHLKNKTNNGDVKELLQLLTKAHIKALLTVHDAVAWKEFEPTLPPFTVDLLEDSESVKVVQLVKNREPLGATIKRHEVTGEITVARIMHGGAAHRSGLLRVGDELKEVNGVRVDRKEPKEVTRILSRGQDYITLKIIPALKVESESAEKKIFLRALCEYKPADDPAIPCSEAGLAFRCGDVLEVMSQDDPTWWQARHMGKSPACAGLIPSQAFMGRRLESRRRASTQTAHGNSKLFPSALRRSFFMGKRSTKVCKASPEYKCRDKAKTPIPGPYEEVVQYRRQPHETFRLVVFVGSPNTDLSELKAELIASNPRHFATIIPTTTRSRKHDEKDGVDFHFVSRNSFDTGLQNYKFVDYSEFKGHMYGVAFDDIRAVLKMGKVCVLDIAVQAISAVRTAEFKPYIVFVKVPCVEALADCADSRWPSSECYGSRVFGEEEKSSTLLEEEQFGHLFDTTLEGGNRESILRELLETLHLLESHPSWIPRPWTVSHPL